MAVEKNAFQETEDAVLDQDHSIGEKAPGTPFALVALSYLAVLALVCGAIAFAIWAFR